MRPFALLSLLLASACADVCTRGERLSKDFPVRQAECFSEGTLASPGFDTTRCRSSMKACRGADETALHAYFDCVEKLPVCTLATRDAFNEQFLGCATGLGSLSEGCFRP